MYDSPSPIHKVQGKLLDYQGGTLRMNAELGICPSGMLMSAMGATMDICSRSTTSIYLILSVFIFDFIVKRFVDITHGWVGDVLYIGTLSMHHCRVHNRFS